MNTLSKTFLVHTVCRIINITGCAMNKQQETTTRLLDTYTIYKCVYERVLAYVRTRTRTYNL